MKNILTLALLLCTFSLFAAPYNGNITTFPQPDGSKVAVKLYGDEYYLRAEGLDGYTLIRDKKTNWICYASLSEDGNTLLSTGIIYHGEENNPGSLRTNLSLAKHLDISDKALQQTIASNKKLLNPSGASKNKNIVASPPVLGDIKGICLVVDFSDYPGTLPMSEFEDFCNNMNYTNFGNNGSLRTFYHDISGGLLDYQNIVYGYYRAPLTFEEYDQMPYSQGAKTILGLALNWVASLGFDFSTLSINPDGSIEAINLMYTGYPPNWAQGMWFHMGSYTGFSANGVHSDAYNCSPANDPLELAVVAHENGHMVGKWPDTYKYNSNTGPDGIGAFDLMCWYGSYTNPVPPNPFFTSDAGWKHVEDVTFFNGLVHDTANSFTCYKFRNLNDTNEFFIMENRSQTGRSADLPDEGLTIWHIDRAGDNQTTHHQVFLEHANNDINDHSQACFHGGFNPEFGTGTTPSSDLYNGDPSGLRAWDMSPVNNIMTYKLGAGQAAPSFLLTYVNISNDNNNNGFLEPGEQGDININASNFGQVNSGNATINLQSIGPNAGYINIVTTSVNAGIINVSQSLPFAFTVSIASNTPLGTIIDLRFTITDGTYSSFMTKHLMIGEMYIMTDEQITTCSGLFFDPGGPTANYSDMTNHTCTFLAPGPNDAVKIEFQTFDLEYETNCDYDYLKIYNGPSTESPLIGKYCGSNSPGTVISTDTSGALTFKFHSDEGVTGAGWSALISCTLVSGITPGNIQQDILVNPNPTTGITILQLPFKGISDVVITDIRGRTVLHSTYTGTEKVLLDLSGEPSGMFILKVINSNFSLTKKLLVVR